MEGEIKQSPFNSTYRNEWMMEAGGRLRHFFIKKLYHKALSSCLLLSYILLKFSGKTSIFVN